MPAPLQNECLPNARDACAEHVDLCHAHHLREEKKKSKQAARGLYSR
jgi:hypothetical protein